MDLKWITVFFEKDSAIASRGINSRKSDDVWFVTNDGIPSHNLLAWLINLQLTVTLSSFILSDETETGWSKNSTKTYSFLLNPVFYLSINFQSVFSHYYVKQSKPMQKYPRSKWSNSIDQLIQGKRSFISQTPGKRWLGICRCSALANFHPKDQSNVGPSFTSGCTISPKNWIINLNVGKHWW